MVQPHSLLVIAIAEEDKLCMFKCTLHAGPDLGGGNRGGCPGPTAFEGAHGAHNNDIHVFLIYSNSF